MTSTAGLRFRVEPDDALTDAERVLLGAMLPSQGHDERVDTFTLHLLSRVPWTTPLGAAPVDAAPATLEVVDDRVRILHRNYLAELDPWALDGRLFRTETTGGGLGVTLRTALSCRLPLRGGLPLHAAGLVMGGHGLGFFGPSGAGKSTLASMFAGEVLSDELVVVQGTPFDLHASGFWGTMAPRGAFERAVPLAALVELTKAPSFSLVRLARRAALQRLLEVILVPLHSRLWSAALSVLGRLISEVPVYRLGWAPSDPPWRAIEAAVLGDARARGVV